MDLNEAKDALDNHTFGECPLIVIDALEWAIAEIERLNPLALDGVHAKERAINRFCALGLELDNSAFDDAFWRKTLASQPLSVVLEHVNGLNVRFDKRYPVITDAAGTGSRVEEVG